MQMVPDRIWQEVAKETLRTQWGKGMIPLPPNEKEEALDREESQLSKDGVNSKVIAALQEIRPLLLEHRAISSALSRMRAPDLRQALPEVVNLQEAANLAKREYRLSETQAATLTEILSRTT